MFLFFRYTRNFSKMPGGFGWNSTFFVHLVPLDFWFSGLRAPDSLQIPSFLCFRPLISDSLQNLGLLASALTATEAKNGLKKGQNLPKMPGETAKVGRLAPDSLQNPLGGSTCAPVTGAKVLLE